jgi:hypothetical protein
MSYSVSFYALNGPVFAGHLRESPQALLDQIETRLRHRTLGAGEEEEFEAGLQVLLDAAKQLCDAAAPPGCELQNLYALCWLAEVGGERITICPYQAFRHLSFLDDVGVWNWFLEHRPPFPVPQCPDPPPQVGYLPAPQISRFALSAFEHLPTRKS